MPARKPVPSAAKKPFRVFEAGTGFFPSGLIRKAAQSEKKGLNRFFAGVDKKLAPNFVSLLLSGRLRLPSNLSLKRADVFSELRLLPRKSQSVIFESYLLNNLHEADRNNFFRLAKRALRWGGRLVMVQDFRWVSYLRGRAEKFGFGFASFPIPDSALKKSPAWAIRIRSTPKKRLKQIKHYNITGAGNNTRIQRLLLSILPTPDKYARPTLIVLQKNKRLK